MRLQNSVSQSPGQTISAGITPGFWIGCSSTSQDYLLGRIRIAILRLDRESVFGVHYPDDLYPILHCVSFGQYQLQQTVSHFSRVHGDGECFAIFTSKERTPASFEQIHQSAITESVESRFQKILEVAQTL
ncbi:hypothetical protein DSECCO2_595430 [anaerobic digester metagenome]